MGHQDRPNAAKRTRKVVMPTVEEIVAEAREAKRIRMENLVSTAHLAAALGRDRSNVRRATKKLGIKYALVELDGTSYLTKEDAAKVAGRLA